ncbi:MAG: CPBP family intramembrane metalloprotease [Polyangiaceae bacterium]|jgi:membrane protease YdiL (CAAX protease family)|nr:CPBP family intramembrane metalloprotease [Polyangiaceae bacterium]
MRWTLQSSETSVLVAEQLVYRSLVQHALRRRVHRHAALSLAGLLFGLAHVAVYRTAVHQPMLLLGFGRANGSSGILASVLMHMPRNPWLSL